MRILLIEDDPETLLLLTVRLKSEGYAVDTANNGNQGSTLARLNDYDLIILDYLLPNKNGAAICEETRQRKKATPIIMLSVQSDAATKIRLLNCGADDYVVKPFMFDEL